MDVKLLTHLSRHEIDDQRWNEAIQTSLNARPYALTWYLDAVTPQWEALVYGDYEAVMPLPVKKRFGIRYYVQPLWTQQLGIFATRALPTDVVNAFWDALSHAVYALKINAISPRGKECPNLILPLDKDYETLQQAFHQNTRRNIRKAQAHPTTVGEMTQEEFLPFWNSLHPDQHALARTLETLATAARNHHAAHFYASQRDGEPTAAVMTIEACGRIVYLAPASNERGKEECAMFAVVDTLIRRNAESATILDFEGSLIPGVRRFYEGFGAQLEPYYLVEHLHPHWLVKLLHR